jgi:hypothetical protein
MGETHTEQRSVLELAQPIDRGGEPAAVGAGELRGGDSRRLNSGAHGAAIAGLVVIPRANLGLNPRRRGLLRRAGGGRCRSRPWPRWLQHSGSAQEAVIGLPGHAPVPRRALEAWRGRIFGGARENRCVLDRGSLARAHRSLLLTLRALLRRRCALPTPFPAVERPHPWRLCLSAARAASFPLTPLLEHQLGELEAISGPRGRRW